MVQTATATANSKIWEKIKVSWKLLLVVDYCLKVAAAHDDALNLFYNFVGGPLHPHRVILGLNKVSLAMTMSMHQRVSRASETVDQ